jgi:hypothetical protein
MASGARFCVVVPVMLMAWPAFAAMAPESLDPAAITSASQRADIAAHFKTRERLDFNPIIYADSFATPDWYKIAKRDEPDRVMNHQVAIFGMYVQFPRDIDWNATTGFDRESVWIFNRFNFLLVLQEAHEKRGEVQFPRKGIEMMLDWVRKCPLRKAGTPEQWAAWRPLEVGLRLNTWCQFLDYAARHNLVQPDELCTLLGSIREQAGFLAVNARPGMGNHGFMATAGLGMTALVFPELKGSGDWLHVVWRNFDADVRSQIYPDGSQEEMSPVYEFTVLWSLARVDFLAGQRKVTVPAIVLDKMRAINRYLAFICKPDRTLPAFNDGDRFNLDLLFALIARGLNQRDVLWLTTGGKEGDKPASPNFFAPYSGLVIFRTDWGPQAQSLLLDAGPFGTMHQHLDALQVEYSAFGQDFLVEPGRYVYRKDPIRDWLNGTSAHCTITVDGGHQRTRQFPEAWRSSQPIDAHVKSTDTFGYARALYRYGYDVPGAEGVMHRRSVFFLPGRYAVIYDLVQGQGEHRVHLHWSFPPIKVSGVSDHAVIAGGPQASLLLEAAGPAGVRTTVTTGQKDPPVGWFSRVFNVVDPAPHATMTVRTSLPARFATLLLPFRGPATQPPSATIQIDPARDEQVRITIGNRSEVLNPAGITSQPE